MLFRSPKELDALFVELGKLPLRGTIPEDGVIESVCAQVKTQCGLVGETLRRLGESRYNQDNATP